MGAEGAPERVAPMTPASIARWLRWLYVVLAVLSAGVALAAALRGQYGSAVLNAALAVVWTALFLRLRARTTIR